MNLDEYVGLPYAPGGRGRDGIDCYGLVRLVLSERFGVELPALAYPTDHEDAENRAHRAELIEEKAASWTDPVAWGEERAGDVVVLYAQGEPLHVGLVVEPGLMLHVHRDCEAGSCAESYRGSKWKHRVKGIRRPRPDRRAS